MFVTNLHGLMLFFLSFPTHKVEEQFSAKVKSITCEKSCRFSNRKQRSKTLKGQNTLDLQWTLRIMFVHFYPCLDKYTIFCLFRKLSIHKSYKEHNYEYNNFIFVFNIFVIEINPMGKLTWLLCSCTGQIGCSKIPLTRP